MTANDPDRPPQDGPLTNETVTSYLAAYRLLESEPPDPRSATERTKLAARPTPNVPKPSEGGKWRPKPISFSGMTQEEEIADLRLQVNQIADAMGDLIRLVEKRGFVAWVKRVWKAGK